MSKSNKKNDIVVCNSEPLIALAGIEHLDLLQKLYKEVLIPEADRALIDERKGRRIAELIYHLNILGTGGILLGAKKTGYIAPINSCYP